MSGVHAILNPAGNQPGVSSYWSVSELQDFDKLVAHFGTRFSTIAKYMKTKTTNNVKNQYLRLVDNGRADLESLARNADDKWRRGKDMGQPPKLTPAPKRRYESTSTALPPRTTTEVSKPPEMPSYTYLPSLSASYPTTLPSLVPSLKSAYYGEEDLSPFVGDYAAMGGLEIPPPSAYPGDLSEGNTHKMASQSHPSLPSNVKFALNTQPARSSGSTNAFNIAGKPKIPMKRTIAEDCSDERKNRKKLLMCLTSHASDGHHGISNSVHSTKTFQFLTIKQPKSSDGKQGIVTTMMSSAGIDSATINPASKYSINLNTRPSNRGNTPGSSTNRDNLEASIDQRSRTWRPMESLPQLNTPASPGDLHQITSSPLTGTRRMRTLRTSQIPAMYGLPKRSPQPKDGSIYHEVSHRHHGAPKQYNVEHLPKPLPSKDMGIDYTSEDNAQSRGNIHGDITHDSGLSLPGHDAQLDQELQDARLLLERLSQREDISDEFWQSVGLTR